MDVVYYVRPGERNEELRYSLRSLRNLSHERVWIVGHRPTWVTGVEYVPGNIRSGPIANAIGNLSLACDAVDAERFVVFNDDFYVTEPIDDVPAWHRGPLSERRQPMQGDLRASLRRLHDLGICQPLDWTMHIPLVVARNVLAPILRTLRDHEWRTMYGNLVHLEGQRHDDVKVRRRSDPVPSGPFLSSSDASFHWLLPLLRQRFPVPSRYEA